MRLKTIVKCALTALILLLASVRVPAQDVAVVNADTVKVKLENNRVRILEASIPPGHKEKMHSHPAYVIHVIAGGKVRNHAADGTTTDGTFVDGDTIYRDALTHWAENIGTTTIRLVLVELKSER